MSSRHLGLLLVAAGIAAIVLGLLAWAGAWTRCFSWFGHLPGDVRIERENVRIDVPFVSMLLVSIVLTLLLNLLRRLF
jgi:hypothetical protein